MSRMQADNLSRQKVITRVHSRPHNFEIKYLYCTAQFLHFVGQRTNILINNTKFLYCVPADTNVFNCPTKQRRITAPPCGLCWARPEPNKTEKESQKIKQKYIFFFMNEVMSYHRSDWAQKHKYGHSSHQALVLRHILGA